jgi:hypothetical protein
MAKSKVRMIRGEIPVGCARCLRWRAAHLYWPGKHPIKTRIMASCTGCSGRRFGRRPSVPPTVPALPVCTENLNPNVLTMKSAQYGARIYDAGSLNLARDRRILVQCPVRSHAVVIVRIVFQNPTQMFLAQDNDVVQTLAPD